MHSHAVADALCLTLRPVRPRLALHCISVEIRAARAEFRVPEGIRRGAVTDVGGGPHPLCRTPSACQALDWPATQGGARCARLPWAALPGTFGAKSVRARAANPGGGRCARWPWASLPGTFGAKFPMDGLRQQRRRPLRAAHAIASGRYLGYASHHQPARNGSFAAGPSQNSFRKRSMQLQGKLSRSVTGAARESAKAAPSSCAGRADVAVNDRV